MGWVEVPYEIRWARGLGWVRPDRRRVLTKFRFDFVVDQLLGRAVKKAG